MGNGLCGLLFVYLLSKVVLGSFCCCVLLFPNRNQACLLYVFHIYIYIYIYIYNCFRPHSPIFMLAMRERM
ncbi:hypothetical protein QBC36DRAFT_6450 [Triangularia setosa]|uniref:Uncharacterized protein n=1 Tax=Triangularia setosa TaxID=2587417 RepID=A0AAN6WFC6_9PEZI|nr:hypothetical protein QBC36DRAFT_6450 [Podospora setosa]